MLLSHARSSSKILIRTYNDDDSTKSLFIDDSMLVHDILLQLIHKNHREPDINYALIEIIPDLHMGNKILLLKRFFCFFNFRFLKI